MGLPQRRALAAAAASPGRGGSRRTTGASAASLRCLGPQTGCTHRRAAPLKAQQAQPKNVGTWLAGPGDASTARPHYTSHRSLMLKLTRYPARCVSPRMVVALAGRRASRHEPSPSRSGALGPSAEADCLAQPQAPRRRPRRPGRSTARGARPTPFPGAAAAATPEMRATRGIWAAVAVGSWGTGAPWG